MRYNLFDGGDYLRRPEDQVQSGYSKTYDVEPAIHHKERNVQIENHYDTQGFAWRGVYEGLGEKKEQLAHIATGDEIVSHLIGAGWQLKAVAYHVKRAGSGTLSPSVELLQFGADGKETDSVKYPVVDLTGAQLIVDMAKPGFYVGLVPTPSVAKAAAALEAEPGNKTITVNVEIPSETIRNVSFQVNGVDGSPGATATGNVVIPKKTVQVEVPLGAAAEGAAAALPVPLVTQTNGYLVNTVTLAQNDDSEDMPLDMCVGIYLDLVNFRDENPCDCAPTPCETTYPDPLCMPL